MTVTLTPTPTTLAQKLVARAARRQHVQPGELVTCDVDLAMSHDSSGPRRVAPMLKSLGATVWDPTKYVVITDHYVPAADAESKQILDFTRHWVSENGITNFHDEQGICHVVLPERGHLKPGMFAVGGDSHSCTGGAFGAYIFGIGATEMLGVLVTGNIWLKVPETILIEWTNRFPKGVVAKDVMLFLCAKYGMEGGQYQAVEYSGSAISALDMQERMTLANMSAELGAQTGLIAPDEVTWQWLRARGVVPDGNDSQCWTTDAGAPLLARYTHDAAALVPHVAAPHSPANAAPVGKFAGQAIDTAYIGACTGAKLHDLQMAALILRGRKAVDGIRLLVAPASVPDQKTAEEDGTMRILRDAGAVILPIGCGACAGYGPNRFGDSERVISSTARNFKGRMGADSSKVWLASPLTVAASAVTGVITDPRDMFGESV